MKPQYHIVQRDIRSSHVSRHHVVPNLGTVWHYHPELEIHYIIRGEGVRFVGDNISNFEAGELLLLGENLPHMWRCSEQYFRRDPNITAEAIMVQFLPDFMGSDFLCRQEASEIVGLYEKAKAGLVVSGDTRDEVVELLRRSVGTDGLTRVILILSMLEVLARSEETSPIASQQTRHKSNKEENDRLNNVYNHALTNYMRDLTLDEMASVANLSVTSFCRYFKVLTKKTFHEFLIEVRISHAKRMLIERDNMTAEAICFECGFNNKSIFFGHFKRKTGLTPLEYKRKFQQAKVM